MDHPGLQITRVSGKQALARWNGQTPTFDLKGKHVMLWSDTSAGRRGRATIIDGDGRRPRGKNDRIRLHVPDGTKVGDFGYADLTPLKFRKGKIISKALDNVAGCAAIVAALIHLKKNRLPGDVLGLFTRAEEVGFHGAFGAIEKKTAPRSRPIIVLECSKELPGAVMGAGPVLRVGDRLRIFDADLLYSCELAARKISKSHKNFRYQRRLMDGGACEASAFALAGYRAICLGFPLGNYHNIGPRGPAPEFIAHSDFVNGITCLAGFAALGVDPTGSSKQLAARLKKRFSLKDKKRLKATAE
jgi:endoglucanase